MSESFEEWGKWKKLQTEPTCDSVGCKKAPYWVLPQQQIFFCVTDAAKLGGWYGLQRMYGEMPQVY